MSCCNIGTRLDVMTVEVYQSMPRKSAYVLSRRDGQMDANASLKYEGHTCRLILAMASLHHPLVHLNSVIGFVDS